MQDENNFIEDAKQLKNYLSEHLFGQERAIKAVSDSIKNNIVKNTNAPKDTYLFLGSPATGKTYLAELMTKNLKDYKIKSFDMTQYHDQNGGELYGYPIGWTGYGIGQLTGFVHDNPKSIIVLDAFEKAANVIQSNLLSIFEGGQMKDGCGWDLITLQPCNEDEDVKYHEGNAKYMVDFRETIFIITSSLGKELYTDNKFIELVDNDYIQAESMILDALKREEKRDDRSGGTQAAIVPELISRFSQATIVLFNKLNYVAFESIGKKAFLEYKETFKNKLDIDFELSKNFNHFLKLRLLIFAPELDARRIRNKIGIAFFAQVTDYLMSLDTNVALYKKIKISVSKEAINFINETIDTYIKDEKLVRELFRKNMTLEIDDIFTVKNDTITYKIKSCYFKQVKRIKDFSEDGLVFDIPNVSFDDIAGHHKAKVRLNEVINFFKSPKLLKEFDIQPPKGMLLYGPTGTGKTLLAKAFAAEANLPFISITGIDLLKVDRTKRIFAKAKEYAPSIIFIDEIDTVGTRVKESGKNIQINQFLSEMDGFSNSIDENIFVIAATNYKDNIDSAIIRPGRIELHIEIDDLDKEARKYFLDKIIKNKPTSGKFDMNKLLMYTAGTTGAQLELIGREASLYCLRHNIDAITQDILIEQINTIKYGEKLSHISYEHMFEETAINQAGHAVICNLLMPNIKINHLTVTQGRDNIGFVVNHFSDTQNTMTIEDFKNRICISLAGRITQVKKYGLTKGTDSRAANDLLQATKDCYNAISHFGMDLSLKHMNISGLINSNNKKQDLPSNKHYQNKIDASVAIWLNEAENTTIKLIDENWEKIERLAQLLLDNEIIYEEDLEIFFDNK
jgi:cell division protease FtsH